MVAVPTALAESTAVIVTSVSLFTQRLPKVPVSTTTGNPAPDATLQAVPAGFK